MPRSRSTILLAVVVILVSALAVLAPSAFSQSYSTVTLTYTGSGLTTYPVSTSAQTVTTSLFGGSIQLSAWRNPGCAVQVPFIAMPGDLISATFSSNVPLDLHIISAGPKFPGIADVFCGFGVPPGSLAEISYRTSYSINWTPPEEYYLINKVTQYFLILDNWQAAVASVYLSVQETPSQMVTTTASATSTVMQTSLFTQILTNTLPLTTSTLAPSVQNAQNSNSQWQIFLAIIPIALVAALYWRSRKKKVERTQVY
jgi:hypothetical protein